ncbi:MAG: hypothetical protein J0H98_02825 [Solirubrobacterales bacterium]|nr:hypothetical protein [Solirubrobacterales bacterium]
MKTAIRTVVLVLTLLLGGAGAASAADVGDWSVETVPGGFEATWTSPDPLPVTSDRPEILLDGVPVGVATVSPDGREVSVTIPGDEAPSTDRLTVRLSGRSLDEEQPELEPRSLDDSSWVPSTGDFPKLDFDPGKKGPYEIRTSDYTRAPWSFPGLRRALETTGHVVAPADPTVAASAPLVLFLHGRHSSCYRPRPGRAGFTTDGWPCRKGSKPVPSDLGYDYLQRILASQGFVTVSIAANGINAQDDALADGGANARAALVRRHLDLWAGWVASGRRGADLSRVVLIGHSRGGEGVNRASEIIPATAPYRIAGQILLAPTDFARQSAAYIPTVTVLPYCDGDVYDLQGQSYTDNSIGLAAGDDSLKSSVVMFGANHNFFNTEWTPGLSKAESSDDSWAPPRSLCGVKSKTRLSAAQQRRVAVSYVAGAVQLMTGGDDRNLQLFDGSPVRVGPVTKAPVISQSVGGGKLTLVPGIDAKLAADPPSGVYTCRGYAGMGERDCAPMSDYDLAPHWPYFPAGLPTRPALAMNWTDPGPTAKLELTHELNLIGRSDLDLRTIVAPKTRTARLGVRLVDADGDQLELTPDAEGRVDGMPDAGGTPARWLARTMRVPVPTTGLGSFDPDHVTAIWITGEAKPECGRGCPKASRVRVLDVSARPSGSPAPPPFERLPLIRLKSRTQAEGGPGRRTVRVPFKVIGAVTDPDTRLRVITSAGGGMPQATTISLAPGQTSGHVNVPYRGDNAFDRDRVVVVYAYSIRGVIPVPSAALVTLKNDDPRPQVRIRALSRSIQAGQKARWRISLSRPTRRPVAVEARFAAAPGLPQLKLGELSKEWVARRTFIRPKTPKGTLLSKTHAWIRVGSISAGHPRVIEIPTRSFKGGPVRGIRLGLRLSRLGDHRTPTVRVHPD